MGLDLDKAAPVTEVNEAGAPEQPNGPAIKKRLSLTFPSNNPISAALREADSLADWIAAMNDKLKSQDLTPEEEELELLSTLDLLTDALGERAKILRARIARRNASAAPVDANANSNANANANQPTILAKLPTIDAVMECLKANKKPQSPKDIWDTLHQAGHEVEASNPVDAVIWALKKLRTRDENVFQPGWGKWCLKSHYTPRRLTKVLARVAGTGGRTKREHSDLTRKGMALARAHGKPIGRKMRSTIVDSMAKYYEARQKGATVAEAAKAGGLSASSLNYYRCRFDVDSWKPGDLWPPPLKGVVRVKTYTSANDPEFLKDQPGALRVVK